MENHRKMEIIFAVDKNWSIGIDGDMLFHIRTDLRRFRDITYGHILVMGRKTFESLPGQRPLPGRVNLVITRNREYEREGILVLNDLDKLDEKLNELDPNQEKKVFLIGGGEMVRQLLDRCVYAHITKVQESYELFDTSIPNLDEDPEWEIVYMSATQTDGIRDFAYVDYQRRSERKYVEFRKPE
ncbi:MAG: dihydrofolate reductase [Tissierellia bacterium]|nr:dihydrofolate reductase [Tissierellia bacterium]